MILTKKNINSCGFRSGGRSLLNILFTGVLFFSHVRILFSQEYNFNIKHYDDEEQLPQNSITHIRFERNGFMWMSSQMGLIRFDGQRFKIYTTNEIPGMRSNRIFWIGNDYSGNLYFEDELRNLFKITSFNTFRKIPGDNDSVLFIRAQYSMLFPFRPASGVAGFRRQADLDKNGVRDLYVIDSTTAYSYYRDNQQEDVIGYFRNGNFSRVRINFELQTCKRFLSGDTLFLLFRSGRAAMIKDGALLPGWSNITGPLKETSFFLNTNFSTDKNDATVPFAEITTSKQKVFTIVDGKLIRFRNAGRSVETDLIFENLPVKEVAVIEYMPGNEGYAIGTFTNGLYVINKNQFRTRIYPNAPFANVNNNYAQLLLQDNSILTNNGTIYSDDSVFNSPLPPMERYTIFTDEKRDIYFQSGLKLWRTDHTFKRVDSVTGIMDPLISCAKDSEGVFWLATTSKILRMGKDGVPAAVADLKSSLDRNLINFLEKISPNEIRIGTTRGLYLYNIDRRQLTLLYKSGNLYVRTIFHAKDGSTWVGTYGQGFYKLVGDELIACPLDDNKYLASVHCFLEDKNGYFWISTNKGLFQIKKNDLNGYLDHHFKSVYYYYYNKSGGFATNEFNGGCSPCAIVRHDGIYSFPSLNGLVWFNPDSLNPLLPDNNIYFDEVSFDSTRVNASPSILISHRFNQLKFTVASPYFGDSYNQKLEYNLSGLNNSWNPFNEEEVILFNSLPSGHYTLQVRKLAGFGNSDYMHASLKFTVQASFFETPLFFVISVLASAIFIYLLFQLRDKSLLHAKRRLEREVEMRTIKQHELINELESSLIKLQVSQENLFRTGQQKEKLSSLIVHDLKSPLKFIDKVAGYLHKNSNQLSPEELRSLIKELSDSTHDVFAFTDSFMYWILAQKDNFVIRTEKIELLPVFDEISRFYSEINRSKGNIVKSNSTKATTLLTDLNMLKVILRNLLDNATKNTQDGEIEITSRRENGDTIISVRDTGKGMSRDRLEKLNADLSLVNELGDEFQGNFGLKIIKDFISQLGAKIEIESEINKGTIVRLVFPTV